MRQGVVPVARRQLLSDPAKVAAAVLAVGAAVALVLLLTGLRRGMGEQVTTYLAHQPPVLVGQEGTRNFLSQTSVLPNADVAKVSRIPGVDEVAPITQGYAMLALHGKHILTVLVGYEPGGLGGPWALAEGRAPRDGEIVLDETLAQEHGLAVGSLLDVRGVQLRIVGLSKGTSGFMTPLAFTTRTSANELNGQPDTATFLLVRPQPRVATATLISRIDGAVPGASALERDTLAARDRNVFVGAFSGPLTAMITIAGAVAILVIAITIYSATRDRSREYATLKAIGLTRSGLLRLVGLQSGALAVLGTVVGVLFALAAVRAVAALAPKYLIALTARDAIVMALAALVFALAAGLVPARYLANLDPARAFQR
jgi:MacB-like periplasmic core domain/FtsX-like permease family